MKDAAVSTGRKSCVHSQIKIRMLCASHTYTHKIGIEYPLNLGLLLFPASMYVLITYNI